MRIINSEFCYNCTFLVISVECHFVDYKFLGVMKRQFPSVPILGLTATATQDVIDDVLKMLSIPNALIFRAPLNRSNLFYEVFACSEIFQLKFCAEIINTLLTIQLCDCYIQDIEKIFSFFFSHYIFLVLLFLVIVFNFTGHDDDFSLIESVYIKNNSTIKSH